MGQRSCLPFEKIRDKSLSFKIGNERKNFKRVSNKLRSNPKNTQTGTQTTQASEHCTFDFLHGSY